MGSFIDSSARYLETHEWARREGEEIVCGISDYAQQLLNELVYVELPRTGQHVKAGDAFAVVESVKSASDVYAPVSGIVVAVNQALERNPEIINRSPYQEGWMARIKPDNPADFEALLTAEAYAALLEELERKNQLEDH
ncbi:MAG: glycine cleavage system protein GcvH [Thermoflexales bacterium]